MTGYTWTNSAARRVHEHCVRGLGPVARTWANTPTSLTTACGRSCRWACTRPALRSRRGPAPQLRAWGPPTAAARLASPRAAARTFDTRTHPPPSPSARAADERRKCAENTKGGEQARARDSLRKRDVVAANARSCARPTARHAASHRPAKRRRGYRVSEGHRSTSV